MEKPCCEEGNLLLCYYFGPRHAHEYKMSYKCFYK